MPAAKLANNQTVVIALCAAFVAVEGYFLYSILGSIIPRFWLSNVVLNMLSVFAAYFIMDALARRINGGRRKRVVVGIVVLTITIIIAAALSIVVMYINRLRLQSTFN